MNLETNKEKWLTGIGIGLVALAFKFYLDLSGNEQEIQNLRKKDYDNQQKITELRNENQNLTDKNNKNQQINNDLLKVNQDFQDKDNNNKQTIANLQNKNNEKDQTILNLNQQIKQKEEQITKLDNQYKIIQKDKENFEKKKEDSKLLANSIQVDVAVMKDRLKELKDVVEQLENHVIQLENQNQQNI